jgi:adenosine kinase
MTVEEILERTETLIITKGEFGSVVMQKDNNKIRSSNIPVAKAQQVNDPTGAGDAYRAGLIKGLVASKKDIVHAAKMGAVCAAYCVEVYGPQNFHFTPELFNKRFSSIFGEKAF